MKKPGRPKKEGIQDQKKQVLINEKSLKNAKIAAIRSDVSLSEWIEIAINEKLERR